MSYSQIAQLELMNALNNIRSEAELNEFRDMVAAYFAQKAQKAIDALWDKGTINDHTIEQETQGQVNVSFPKKQNSVWTID